MAVSVNKRKFSNHQCLLQQFRQNVGTERTDRQTDGQTDGLTEMSYRYRVSNCHAMKAQTHFLGRNEFCAKVDTLAIIIFHVTRAVFHGLRGLQYLCIYSFVQKITGIGVREPTDAKRSVASSPSDIEMDADKVKP